VNQRSGKPVMLWNRPCQNLFPPNETMAHRTMRTTILGGRDPPGRPIPKYIKAQPGRQFHPSLVHGKKGVEKGSSKD